MVRLVQVNRWKDLFWNDLHPYPKILLCYLYDTADSAGFVDYSSALWLTQLKGKTDSRYSEFTKKDLVNALEDLKDKLISNGKKKLFIKDFLKHQKKLPLIRGTEESDWIIDKLESNLPKFNNAKEISDILEKVRDKELINNDNNKNTSARNNNKTKFIAPSYEEFHLTYLKEKPDAIEEKIKNLYDHYVSVGWKVGNKPMADYAAAIRKNMNNSFNTSSNNNYNNNNGEKRSKVQKTMSVVEKMTNQNPIQENN